MVAPSCDTEQAVCTTVHVKFNGLPPPTNCNRGTQEDGRKQLVVRLACGPRLYRLIGLWLLLYVGTSHRNISVLCLEQYGIDSKQ